VLINERFAGEHFPGEDPIGQRIAYDRVATPESIWREIIGVVGDQHQVSPGEPARAEVFEHRRQDWSRTPWIVVRTRGEAEAATPTVRAVLAELDPLIPLQAVRPLREVWRSSMAREELMLTLLGVFGGLALLLATVGVYGVTAQAAGRRRRELGIRVALGADRNSIATLVLRQGMAAVVGGLAVGLVLSLVGSRALAAYLHGVTPTDPATLVAVSGLLAMAGFVACWVPARRATRLDPSDSLRAEG
jgi:predicted lysophospholipase L1 biosynthesis ABC-type transport system permease subunit